MGARAWTLWAKAAKECVGDSVFVQLSSQVSPVRVMSAHFFMSRPPVRGILCILLSSILFTDLMT